MLSKSKAQTQKLAAKLAKKILKVQSLKLKAQIIALDGELGSGKTTFVQGFMKGLGIKHHITSPTFIIFRRHEIPKSYQNVYHFDLYRIHKPKEILALGFRKIIHDSHNIVLIEWPEKIKKILPKNSVFIYLKHGKKENQRIIEL